jgi:peroxiredoxin
MNRLLCAVLLFSLSTPVILHAQAKPPSQFKIQDDLDELKPRAPGMPGPDGKPTKPLTDDERIAKIAALAAEINLFPAGSKKVNFALELAQLSTQGDPHKENIQAVTDTLSKALTETPTSGKKGKPAPAYMELARLVHYAGMTTTVTDPQLTEAEAILTANDADVAKADFTLIDLNNKKVTLSALRGKIVLVNFFSLACVPCQTEMVDLNLIYSHYQSQGLVILSITDDDIPPVGAFARRNNITYPILFDRLHQASEAFHVENKPRDFVFDRDGKLIGQSIDMMTQQQIFTMLARAGLKPQ